MWLTTDTGDSSIELINVNHIIRIRGKKEAGICKIVADTINGKEFVLTRVNDKLAGCPNCSECNKATGFSRIIELLKPYDLNS
ncbi:MAG: hypothetical protein HQK96_18595 [Nitrospirae bacterium]|nr:hypothetical protein [Nitrospirota bacterium]